MKTIALRYNNKFAPEDGTIAEHNKIIEQFGYVWYGKLGRGIARKSSETILENDVPRFLLINTGTKEYFWAYVSEISQYVDDINCIPSYYRDEKEKFGTWFRVTRIEKTDVKTLEKCVVSTSERPFLEALKSMSPFFTITYDEG